MLLETREGGGDNLLSHSFWEKSSEGTFVLLDYKDLDHTWGREGRVWISGLRGSFWPVTAFSKGKNLSLTVISPTLSAVTRPSLHFTHLFTHPSHPSLLSSIDYPPSLPPTYQPSHHPPISLISSPHYTIFLSILPSLFYLHPSLHPSLPLPVDSLTHSSTHPVILSSLIFSTI